ncbi:MAG: uncharacterized protein QOD74_2166 [Variibacter sp.]|jgi:predicted phosphate transport protein (TIGR00153 family)|nr:uncharacterized protein [Variibacter sp.]
MRWFRAIMPREERFFDLFARHSLAVLAGAEALRAVMDGGDRVPEHVATVMARENDADVVTREILIAVRRTFITPFDRGAIKDLATAMDNTIDQMQKTAKGVMLFDVRTFTPYMREMADHIVTSATLVREAVPLMQALSDNAGKLAAITEQISKIEGQADELHDLGLRELYQHATRTNAMDFIVGNEIYDHLEKVVDRFDDVANELHGIVLEQV